MLRTSTGRYEPTTVAGELVNAFIPNALPPSPVIELSGARQQLLERATLAIGRLDSICTLLPDPHQFLYSYVRREAILSSQIEGTQSSLSDLLLFELEEAPGTPVDDVIEVSNYVAALEHGMARLEAGFPLSNRLLREMHATLMRGGRGSERAPGDFRRSQNWIGGTRPGNARFVPPPPHQVEHCLADLEKFIHADDSGMPVLLKAAVAHVQFETIHPFLDGNGRVGRLLIAIMLHHGGLLSEPMLYLSLYFKQHRQTYYELLNKVRTDGDWESWIDFFLEGVERTADSAIHTARNLNTLFKHDGEKIQGFGRSAGNLLKVHGAMISRPLVTLPYISRTCAMSFPTAGKAVQRLVDAGMVRELTGQQRNRVFVYSAYHDILNEGGKPI